VVDRRVVQHHHGVRFLVGEVTENWDLPCM
jgi:hypothetical protein